MRNRDPRRIESEILILQGNLCLRLTPLTPLPLHPSFGDSGERAAITRLIGGSHSQGLLRMRAMTKAIPFDL